MSEQPKTKYIPVGFINVSATYVQPGTQLTPDQARHVRTFECGPLAGVGKQYVVTVTGEAPKGHPIAEAIRGAESAIADILVRDTIPAIEVTVQTYRELTPAEMEQLQRAEQARGGQHD
jgi:hypothetical protein